MDMTMPQERSSDRLDLLIVGAGPTGLTLACLCRRLGIGLRIIDRNPGPSTTSKAIGLQYRVSEILACLGIVDRFLERGASPRRVNIYEGDRHLLQVRFDRIQSRLQGSRGTEEVRSSYLVSCEGAHSLIRRQSGIAFAGKTYPLAFGLADVEVEWLLNHEENHVWIHRQGSLAALPLPGPRRWRLFFEMAAGAEEAEPEVSEEIVYRMLEQRLGAVELRIERFIWLSDFRINCRLVDRFRAGRVFLAGDAAHIHSPTGGQGITTCLQDAANLSWKLARVLQGAPDALLDTYQEERLPRAREVLNETDRLTRVFFAPNPLLRLLRDRLLFPLMRLPALQKRMFAKLAQLHVHYRGSVLSRHQVHRRRSAFWRGGLRNGPSRTLRAGDRAPDVCFMRTGLQTSITLFQLLEEVRPLLLLGPDIDPRDEKRIQALLEGRERLDIKVRLLAGDAEGDSGLNGPSLHDHFGDFRRLYGLSGDFLCLIRPDGHLGLVQRPLDLDALRDYLLLICPRECVEEVLPPGGPASWPPCGRGRFSAGVRC